MSADLASRIEARRRLDLNIVVEAGAGTGKTTLLTDRILFLLVAGGPEKKGIPLPRLVALTFTEKAAGEIKLRLADRLHDLLSHLEGRSVPPARLERLRHWILEAREAFGVDDARLRTVAEQALRDLDRAPLGTLHHFCGTLLRLFPLEAGVGPGFQVDAGEARAALFRETWSAWLEESLAMNAPRADSWREVLPRVGLTDVAELAQALVERDWPAPAPAATAARLRALREGVENLPVGKPAPRRGKMLESLAKAADRLRVLEKTAADPLGPLPPPDPAPWRETPKTWPAEWKEFPGEDLYREALRVANDVTPEGEAVVARVRDLLVPFVARFRAEYRARGWMGFDDLLQNTRDLLAHHPPVRRALKNKFDAFLVDEFQDTDPLQGEILLFLTEEKDAEAERWRDVVLERGKLFIVGDPKQSVYRFRGADIRAYEHFVRLVLDQGGLKCDLQTSYRSHARIVEPVNRLFSQAMRESPGLQPAYLPLYPRPGTEGDAGGVELVLVAGGGEDPLSARASQEREAGWLARWIVDHCGPEGSGRPWRAGDVAILFRSTAALPVYMEALKNAHVPTLVESDRAFYGTPEVMDFLNWVRVVLDPADTVSLVGLLRSPRAAVRDADLLVLSDRGLLDDRAVLPEDLPAALRGRVENLFAALGESRRWAFREPLGAWAGRVMATGGLLESCAAAYHGEQTVSNLMKLVRWAEELGAREGETLSAFGRRLSRAVARQKEEGESPLGEEQVDAVRLLTVHKAKGLEYKVVFVPNLGAKTRAGTRSTDVVLHDWGEGRVGHRLPGLRWADAAMVFLEGDERRREEEESVRLFYVAATRAKEKLFLLGGDKAARGSFLSMLQAAAVPDKGAWVFPEGFRLECTEIPPQDSPGPLWPHRSTEESPREETDLSALWDRRRSEFASLQGAPVFLRPSAMKEGGPRGGSPFGPSENAAAVGTLCHAVLEKWDFKNPGDLSRAVGEARQRVEDLSEAAAAEAEGLLRGFLVSPAARSLAHAEILAREIPFVAPEAGGVTRGVMDLLYRKDGRLWVADYKTDRLAPGEARTRAAAYAPQGEAYRRAVEQSLGERCGFEVIFLRTGDRIPLP